MKIRYDLPYVNGHPIHESEIGDVYGWEGHLYRITKDGDVVMSEDEILDWRRKQGHLV